MTHTATDTHERVSLLKPTVVLFATHATYNGVAQLPTYSITVADATAVRLALQDSGLFTEVRTVATMADRADLGDWLAELL